MYKYINIKIASLSGVCLRACCGQRCEQKGIKKARLYLALEGAASLLEHGHLRTQLPGGGWGWAILLALPVPLHWALCSHGEQSQRWTLSSSVKIKKQPQQQQQLPSNATTTGLQRDSIQSIQIMSSTVWLRPGIAWIWSDEEWGPANSFRTPPLPPPPQHLPSVSHGAPVRRGTPCSIRDGADNEGEVRWGEGRGARLINEIKAV